MSVPARPSCQVSATKPRRRSAVSVTTLSAAAASTAAHHAGPLSRGGATINAIPEAAAVADAVNR
jgi:hypothetical protein